MDILTAGGVHPLQARDMSMYLLIDKIEYSPTKVGKIEVSIELEEPCKD